MPALRFHVEPRDVPACHAGRRLGLSEAEFSAALTQLLQRGFPPADPTTGRYDLDAIDAWRRGRHAQLFADPTKARDGSVVMERLTGCARG